ncbi:hypothetical protein Q3G72_001053 [Acer saccharum]|nr:hypothetical protein Q3G72_001053 [Acer saccharum]
MALTLTLTNTKIPSSGDDGDDDGDKLSNLLKHLIRHILSFLETIDVIRVGSLPEFSGFISLKSLNLCKVEFSDSVVLAMFVSGCPILESLIIYSCVFGNFKILDITAPRLRNLTINVLAFHGDGLNCENVLLYFDSDLSDITIFEESCNLLNNILKGIRNIEVLKLLPTFLEFLLLAVPKPECFSASFCNLKSLMLYVTMDEYDQSIIHLLNRSPILEALSVFFRMDLLDTNTLIAFHLTVGRLE